MFIHIQIFFFFILLFISLDYIYNKWPMPMTNTIRESLGGRYCKSIPSFVYYNTYNPKRQWSQVVDRVTHVVGGFIYNISMYIYMNFEGVDTVEYFRGKKKNSESVLNWIWKVCIYSQCRTTRLLKCRVWLALSRVLHCDEKLFFLLLLYTWEMYKYLYICIKNYKPFKYFLFYSKWYFDFFFSSSSTITWLIKIIYIIYCYLYED